MRLSVLDLSAKHHFIKLVQGYLYHFEKFVLVRLALSKGKIFGEIHIYFFVEKCGGAVVKSEIAYFFRNGASLLAKLSANGVVRILVKRIKLASRYLKNTFANSVAVLTYANNVAVRCNGNNADCAVVSTVFANTLVAVWKLDVI